MLMPAVSMVARTRAMQPRTVRISFPRIAAAIEQSADGKVATGSLDNRTALGFSFRSHGPSFVIGAVIGLVLFSVARSESSRVGRWWGLPLDCVRGHHREGCTEVTRRHL